MKRMLIGLVAVALLAGPAMAQTATSRSEVVALCAADAVACAEVLAAFLATVPPAARLAAYEAIVTQLSDAGVVVTLPPPPAPAAAAAAVAPLAAPTAAPTQASGT